MVLQYICVLALAGLAIANKPGEHTGDVDGAFENVEWTYSDALCLDLLLVDCASHVTQGDEQICGSDGNTYANHCKFVHAVCEYHYSKYDLTAASHGACPVVASTLPPSVAASTVAPPASTIAPVGGSQPPAVTMTTITASPGMSTDMPKTTAPPTTTTTMAMSTTTSLNHQIIQNVFCLNAATISCSASGVDVICGSDGVLYANQCEFAKAHCKTDTLSHADPASCTAPGRR